LVYFVLYLNKYNIKLKLTFFRDFRSIGSAAAMYLEWKANPELFTSFAKIPSALQVLTKSLTLLGGPDIVTLSSLLWQAATKWAGNFFLVSSQDKPKFFKYR